MVARGKRKRENGTANGGAAFSASATLCDETRITDPYGLSSHACKFADHHRKKGKNTVIVANCADNPNCLFGLGEHQEGIWQKTKLMQRVLGDDPREQMRVAYAPTTPPDAPTVTTTTATTSSRRKFSASLSQLSHPSSNNSRTNSDTMSTTTTSPSPSPPLGVLPCGLRNLGATCYLNSMLQTLFTNVAFRDAVYKWEPKSTPTTTNDQLALQMRALQKLFGLMQLGKRAIYDPNEFASTLSLNSVVQQDAQEFSKLLLTHLRMIFAQSRLASHWDLVDRLFQGHMSYVTTCLRCQHRSERPSSYYEISLNIKGHKTVQACLASYLSPEMLDGENKYFCDVCASKEIAERTIELDATRLPQTLNLQLMRFVYDAHAGRKKKLMDVIEVNETLNMSELLRRTGHVSAYSDAPDAIYRLSGYLNHRGKTTHAGHYTAVVAYPKSDDLLATSDWFEFDDSVVNNMASIVDTEGSKERHGKILRSRDAYMLLYARVEAADVTATAAALAPSLVMPAPECLEEIQTLNAVFDADVEEYTANASALEVRMQQRLDAYERLFVASRPAPARDATEWFWVDTSWLRSWIVGEETQPQGGISGSAASATAAVTMHSSEQLVAVKSEQPSDVVVATEEEATSSTSNSADAVDVKDEVAAPTIKPELPVASLPSVSDDNSNRQLDGRVRAITLRSQSSESDVVNSLPFAKPLDMARFCCIHSLDAALQHARNGTHNNSNNSNSKKLWSASFSPENITKLKRVSAALFMHLCDTCGLVTSNSNTQAQSPLVPTDSRLRRRTSDHDAFDASGVVFDATSFRCRACEAEFCNKLLDDAEMLRSIEFELQLLKAPVASDDPHPHLVSRAWIASYKTHLVALQKKILHKPTKKSAKRSVGASSNDDREATTAAVAAAADDATLHSVWRAGLNLDIVCEHGSLCLQKKRYKTVPYTTWEHFARKFSGHVAFPEQSSNACAQCEVAEAASEEVIQVERACRDVVLHRAPLARLYRRRAPDSGAMFSLRAAFFPNGPVSSSVATASAQLREMFLVPQHWLELWRAYIRDVEHDAPPMLTCYELLCDHNRLLLPQTILASLKGERVDCSNVAVAFVSRDEMIHLAELYGSPDGAFFYGQLRADDDDSVEWRRCSRASLLGLPSADESDSVPWWQQQPPDGTIDDGVTPAHGAHANCFECEKMAAIQHLDALQNFQSRVLHVHLLAPDQPVPLDEKLVVVEATSSANGNGSAAGPQRRSKRIRSGAGGISWPILANSNDSVYVLKTKVYDEIDALPIRQRLYFCGRALEDRLSLKECGIKAGDAVFMRLSDETPDESTLGDDALEREVGFEDSVFLRHSMLANGASGSRNGGTGGNGVWVCSACTYVNDETDLVCEMCSTEIE